MKSTIFLAGAFLAVFSLGSLAEDSGWISLFDGKTLNGWKHSTLGTAKYSVAEGAIKGETVPNSPNSFLISEKEYADFELEFEVKVHPQLNSGVQIRSREKTEADLTDATGKKTNDLGRFFGPQVEIEASPGQAGFIYGESTGRGWLSPEPGQGAAHNHFVNGEWNKFRVLAQGARIQVWINGEAVADLTDEAIFKTHPKGHIGLQVHGIGKAEDTRDVYWRNIRIKPL